jgi:putative mycofactocin binding protein MftB
VDVHPGQGAFDPSAPARLSPLVSLRAESFGALAYHFGTRRLVFLKSPALVGLVESLAEHGSAADALDAQVPPEDRDHYLAALARLYDSGVIDAA